MKCYRIVMDQARAILFDFDYTLADSSSAVVKCANHALTGLGLDTVSEDKIRRTIGLSLPDTLAELAGEKYRCRALEFRSLWRELSDQIMVDETYLFPGVVETLVELQKRGLRLGIVSTKFRSRIEEVLFRERMTYLFQVVVGGEDVLHHKPHPEGLDRALRKLNLNASETVYVGDSRVDAQTAKNANIRFIAAVTGVTDSSAFSAYKPCAVISCFAELTKLLV